jgi:hypothetical protein
MSRKALQLLRWSEHWRVPRRALSEASGWGDWTKARNDNDAVPANLTPRNGARIPLG